MPLSQAQADVRLGHADARSPGGTDEAALSLANAEVLGSSLGTKCYA